MLDYFCPKDQVTQVQTKLNIRLLKQRPKENLNIKPSRILLLKAAQAPQN